MTLNLLEKYNVPTPRYTSYPTVPYWDKAAPSTEAWVQKVKSNYALNSEISLYIHLPYCEELCTYCGCNKRITKNHQVESPYIDTLLKEWSMYLELLPEKPIIRELHLGGGTPTFFSPKSLDKLMRGIQKTSIIPANASFSFEAHPSSTSLEHLASLKIHGFKRISIGVQDFDQKILQTINRKQTLTQVENVTKWARELGYESINYDLIFGLPHQTKEHIKTNFSYLYYLRPERIAFYSYAHVPWVSPSQRAYSESDLPKGAQKRALYECGRTLLEAQGYQEIGMDHFALPDEALALAQKNGTLHRNFMGYTPFNTRLSIGLGASSISDSWDAYVQNEKKVETYSQRIHRGEFPIIRGHLLHDEDQSVRTHILNLMCHNKTTWANDDALANIIQKSMFRLKALEQDGLIALKDNELIVLPEGQPFVRNICMAIDSRYWKAVPQGQVFSQSV